MAVSRAAAVQKFQNWLIDGRAYGRNPDEYFLRLAGSEDETPAAQAPNWETVNHNTGEVVHRFYADNQNNAIAAQFDYLTSQGLTTDDFTLQSIERAPRATPNDAAWEREQQSYRAGRNWEVYNADDQNIVVRTLNNMEAEQVAATLPRLEDELNLPRGSLRVRVV
jgi:hypothetical protein